MPLNMEAGIFVPERVDGVAGTAYLAGGINR